MSQKGGIGSGTVSAGSNGHGGGNGNDSGVVVLVVVAAGAVVVLIVVYRCEDQGKAPSTGNTKSQPTWACVANVYIINMWNMDMYI